MGWRGWNGHVVWRVSAAAEWSVAGGAEPLSCLEGLSRSDSSACVVQALLFPQLRPIEAGGCLGIAGCEPLGGGGNPRVWPFQALRPLWHRTRFFFLLWLCFISDCRGLHGRLGFSSPLTPPSSCWSFSAPHFGANSWCQKNPKPHTAPRRACLLPAAPSQGAMKALESLASVLSALLV